MRPAVPEELRLLTPKQLAAYMRERGIWLSGRAEREPDQDREPEAG